MTEFKNRIKELLKTDRREYTMMIVPHNGQSVFSLRIPIRFIKWTGAVLAAAAIFTAGSMLSYQQSTAHELQTARTEKTELEKLRKVSGTQEQQLEELARLTASLQEDMKRVNALDAEVRKMVASDDVGQVSRSAPARIAGEPGSGGQGGVDKRPQAADLLQLAKDIKANAAAREESLTSLKGAIEDKKSRLAATPSIWPADGEVTSRFGWRNSPFGYGSSYHSGLDIADSTGTPIYAAADGVVTMNEWYGGYGNAVMIDHGNGIETLYAHNTTNLVTPGQRVKKGQHIANMGSTGNSTGSHLHYEVRINGTAVDPMRFLN